MNSTKYVLTKYETTRRTEKVEYIVTIPEYIKNKVVYADEQVLSSNYSDYRIVDIVDSEMLDEEIHGLRRDK